MSENHLNALIKELENELLQKKKEIQSLKSERTKLTNKIENYITTEKELKAKIDETEKKLKKVVELKDGQYEEVIKEIFTEPIKNLTNRINDSSRKSTKSASRRATVALLITTTLSLLLNFCSGNELKNQVSKVNSLISVYNKPEISKKNIEVIKSIVLQCDIDKKGLEIENKLQDYYDNCIEPNLGYQNIPVNYEEIFLAFSELGMDYTLEQIRSTLFDIDLNKVIELREKYDSKMSFDSLQNYSTFSKLKKRLETNYYDTTVVQSRKFVKSHKKLKDAFYGELGKYNE